MIPLDTLASEIQKGWRVKIIDHDYLNDSRDDVEVTSVYEDRVVLTSKRFWHSQERRFTTTVLGWRVDPASMEVEGRTVRIYHTPPPHTGKSRRLIKTYIFMPPR